MTSHTTTHASASWLAAALVSCLTLTLSGCAGDREPQPATTSGEGEEAVSAKPLHADLSAMPAHATLPEFVEIAPGLTPEDLQRRVGQFAPVTLTFDEALLDPGQKTALKKLVEASDYLDDIFLEQVWRGGHRALASGSSGRPGGVHVLLHGHRAGRGRDRRGSLLAGVPGSAGTGSGGHARGGLRRPEPVPAPLSHVESGSVSLRRLFRQ
ncbi:MAG: hypothetical protein P8Y21_09790 [Gemmatimonadales bacterium]